LPIGEKSLFLSSVEKRQLVDLLHHYTSSSNQEAEEIISLREEYPYSQVLQALSARVSKDHDFDNQQQFLQSAAVYSTDRTVLKEIMLQAYVEAVIKEEETEVIGEMHKPAVSPPNTRVNSTIDSIDYADEVLIDLKRLNELKLNFESVAATINPKFATEATAPVRRPPGRPKKNVENPSEPFIEAIKTSKKKIDPESSTTKEQIAIIDQFIKAQPSIVTKLKADPSPVSPGDLAEIKSGEYTDSIVSETLAEILIRQGKKEKAIEVFKKLIWKFPQKKAYFAAQIEELKK